MRDPATRIDPEVEAAIEEARRFLETRVNRIAWKADPPYHAIYLLGALEKIENSSLPDWVKGSARKPLLDAARKRKAKPLRRFRDLSIASAACSLVKKRGYQLTRNEVTRDRESAASIVQKALVRLGASMSEKQVNAIVLKWPPDPPC